MCLSNSCAECGVLLNLSSSYEYPADLYFKAGNRGTLSFSAIDDTKFRFEKEDKLKPFFATLKHWGIQRKRTKLKCASCGKLVGYVYNDGPPATDGIGQFGMGPSQAVPRNPRYRLKIEALKKE